MKIRRSYFFLPALLLALWLLLNDSLSAGHILLGLIFAVWLSLAARPFRPVRASFKRPGLALCLIWKVAIDIVKSNYEVGRIVILGKRYQAQPGFLQIPLKMTDPHGLAALACIITYTPGTVWSGHDTKSNVLTLHVLDLYDEQQWLDTIQKRYEAPLLEIFT